jgi:hypothetical protein
MDATDKIIKTIMDIPISPELSHAIQNVRKLKNGMRGMPEIGVATAQKIIGIDQGYIAASNAINDAVFMGLLGPRKSNGKHDVRPFR